MTRQQHKVYTNSWIVSFREALFEGRIVYTDNQFIGFSSIFGILPRQLHLDF